MLLQEIRLWITCLSAVLSDLGQLSEQDANVSFRFIFADEQSSSQLLLKLLWLKWVIKRKFSGEPDRGVKHSLI